MTASAYNNGFDKDAVKLANEYAYDTNGNLTKDLNKNIIDIQYNCLNLPNKVTFGDGSTIIYTYAADGTKLKVVHKIGDTTTTTDYCGDVIYENGVQKLLLTEEGYVTLSDSKYHYYLKDHQGNNRVVVNKSGTVEETNHYYPFGGTFASTVSNIQPYKYNGKELDRKNGLNLYDYGARHYDAALGRFMTIDPLSEKYYGVSPYTYCINSPIKFIDQDGKEVQAPIFFGLNTPLFASSNPLISGARYAGALGTTDKVVRALPQEQHHIIPKSLRTNRVIEKAQEGGFKLDGKGNKMGVDKFSKATGEGRHAKHPQYTKQIKNKLNDAFKENPQMTPEQAVNAVKKIQSGARNDIESNPNTKINDLQLKQQIAPVDNTKTVKPNESIKIKYKSPWEV